jgi:ABC-type multidrug transport system permease subunit
MQLKLEADFHFLRFWVFTFLAIFLTGIIEFLIIKGNGTINKVILYGSVLFGIFFIVTLIPFTIVYFKLRKRLK